MSGYLALSSKEMDELSALDLSAALAEKLRVAALPRSAREQQIIDMVAVSDGSLEVDLDAVVSEGDDNGAYVQAWVWVDFADTDLDKENDNDLTAP
jgi:hypothetical protein